MSKKIFFIGLISLILFFATPIFLYAQTAAPPVGPLLTSINPSSGEQGQILELTILGENFQKEALVSFSPAEGISLISIKFITAAEIKFDITIASDAPLLPRDVIIINPNQLTGTFKQGFNVKPASDRTPPPPVLGLTATDALDGKVDLAWIPSDAEDFGYYAIYWSEENFVDVTDMVPPAEISNQTNETYQATELQDDTKYYFAVTAVDKNGNEDKKVITANAIPTPSSVPPVTIPIPTTPTVNITPTPTTSLEAKKPTPSGLPAGIIPLIILASLAALAGLIYSIKKHLSKSKKSLKDRESEIKKEKKFRFLNEKSKLTKLEIRVGTEKTLDLVQKIINLRKTPGEAKTQLEIILGAFPLENGIPIDLALKICETKELFEKILEGPMPAKELKSLEYTITIEPVSGVDVEREIAEVSLSGQLQPSNKYEIKKHGDNFTYMKKIKIIKTDTAWKEYASDLQPEFADLKKIIQIHLEDLERQKQEYEDAKNNFIFR